MSKKIIALAISTTLLTISPLTTLAHEKGDWLVRIGAATVDPDDSSSTIAANGTSLAETGVGVDSGTAIGLNIVHMMTDNIAIELLAATPFKHDLKAEGVDIDLGDIKHLPPTLSLQYYFGHAKSELRPYIGIGLNYTTFFEENLSSKSKSVLNASNLDLDDSTGLSAQMGIDWAMNEKWFTNVGIRYIDINTEATLNSALGQLKVDVDIDPWVYMISLGTKF